MIKSMSKGVQTRQIILEHAAASASRLGLEGLSIGQLATELQMSKSGLFGHFRSKEELQIQVLDTLSDQFTKEVIRPALTLSRGEARLRSIFEHWLAWGLSKDRRHGCPFMAAAMEFDDRPGAVRDKLVATQKQLIHTLETTIKLAQEVGAFKADGIPAQLVQELYGIMLSAHFYHRLLQDQAAADRARAAFETFLKRL